MTGLATDLCPACGQPVPQDGELVFDDERGLVSANGHVAKLSGNQLTVFRLLHRRKGRAVPLAAIYDELYWLHSSKDAPEDQIIRVWMCRLRKELRPLGLSIKTHWGIGYELERSKNA